MKSFKLGVIVGTLGSAAIVAGSALIYQHKVLKPIEQAEEEYNEVSKAAIRRSVAAHQSRY
ncbi:hypothetical protein GCM10025879_15070 [Leuconostoc litchii]|uniref:DUF3042 family protein n=1 Tax=Leuconostoc litchii TaxID=1981069 RepID=A0A652NDP9_9LACO|nr:DUF3042 family protein [Leuconostoc litchii]TYC46028.1 DUF3042 family protein [Leuconostoc litchii]GMA70261.1 hypothetical protein GCM10025879_15070 [Leuconostoc litchii]